MNEIWVVGERNGDRIHEGTLEMLGELRRIADGTGRQLAVVLLGSDTADLIGDLASYGADRVYRIEHPALAVYSTLPYVDALTPLVQAHDPWLVALSATPDGSDLAGRLAGRLRRPLAAGCTALKLNSQKQVEATKPVYEDRVYSTLVWREDVRPLLATVRPGAIGVEKPRPGRTAEVLLLSPDLPAVAAARPVGFIPADPATIDLTEAAYIVAGGRGVGSAEKWRLIEDLAAVLGAAVGGTRVVKDLGWIPLERQIGQTGKIVKPRVYFAIGISGASQHVEGMKAAERIIVINHDRAAPIFALADVAVDADLHELLPVLIEKIMAATRRHTPEPALATGSAQPGDR